MTSHAGVYWLFRIVCSCQDITCGPCAPAVGEVRGVEPPELLLAVAFDPDLAAAMVLARMRLIALAGRAAAAAAPAHRHGQAPCSTTLPFAQSILYAEETAK